MADMFTSNPWTLTAADLLDTLRSQNPIALDSLYPDGLLVLAPASRLLAGWHEQYNLGWRDRAPLTAYVDARKLDENTWRVRVRVVAVAHGDPFADLAYAAAFAEEPAFELLLTPENLTYWASRRIELGKKHSAAWMLLSAFRTVGAAAQARLMYRDALSMFPGMTLDRVNDIHSKLSGTWHGHPFVVRIRGRQARLNIWQTNPATEHPAWWAKVAYNDPLPLWQQLPPDAVTAMRTLLTDLAARIAANENSDIPVAAHPFTMTL